MLRVFFTGALLLLGITGCGKEVGEISPTGTNLAWLGSMYGMYLGQHNGQPPKKIDDLRKFVESKTGAEQLARLQVASVSELFVSTRDGKPFRLVTYDKLPAQNPGEPPPAVLYEEVGQGGQRVVVYLGGSTATVDEATLKSQLPGGKL